MQIFSPYSYTLVADVQLSSYILQHNLPVPETYILGKYMKTVT